MTKKLITLTPSDSFFFGGEQTFGNGKGRNYYAESRYFPQQTSIVGLIRHVLFEAHGSNHFGSSFNVNTDNNFGWLHGVSPVFIFHPSKGIGVPLRLPIDVDEKPKNVHIRSDLTGQIDLGHGLQPASLLADYNPKHGTKRFIVFSNEQDKTYRYDEIFKEVIKTGIARDRKKHTTIDGMFYRQRLFKMKADYSFGVYVEAKDDALFDLLDHRNMPFGGEKVNFVVQTLNEGSFQIPIDLLRKHIKGDDWIFLASDAYVPESIYEHCSLAMADSISFRNIVTPSAYTANLDQSEKDTSHRRYKTEKMALLQRGSILFPKGENAHTEILKLLDNQQFKEIGYNHYYSNFKTK